MELHQLECFAYAARSSNFSKAAEEMHISQPALSSCIRLLEDELNVKLFERKGRIVKLNDIGRRILNHVNTILGECSTIYQICEEIATGQRKRVTVLPAVTSWIVPYLLNDFAKAHPEISLEIVIEERNAKELVDSKEADISIMASVDELSKENVRTLYKEEIMLAVPLGHSLAESDAIDLVELKPHTIISLTPGRPLRSIEDYFFSLAGFTPKRTIECDSSALLRNLLESGYGPALVPTKSWKGLNTKKCRLVHINKPTCFRYISIMYNKAPKDPAVMKTFDFITSLFEQDDLVSGR